MDIYSTIELNFNDAELETLPHVSVYLTSEENSHGITFFVWRDGKETKLRLNKKWIQHHIWMKLYPEKFLRKSKTTKTGHCTQQSHYQYLGANLIEEIDMGKCKNKCLPSSLHSIIPLTDQRKIPLCQTKEDEKCAFSAARDVNYNIAHYQKPCSIFQYNGDFDFWTPEEDGRAKSNTTFSFGWWFPPPGAVKLSEEYLIIDTITMITYVASTLGMFIGFSFSGVIGFIFRFIQKQWVNLN